MYVVIEGIDATGKSTQIALLREKYKNAIFTKEPSDSEFGAQIRQWALHSDIGNLAQAMLFLADRAEHAQRTLLPNKNSLVISDRSLISGIAYAKNLDFRLATRLNRAIAPLPNLAIILLTNGVILRERLSAKKCDNIEQQGIKYLLEVQDRIVRASEILGVKSVKIACDMDRDAIFEIICKAIDAAISGDSSADSAQETAIDSAPKSGDSL